MKILFSPLQLENAEQTPLLRRTISDLLGDDLGELRIVQLWRDQPLKMDLLMPGCPRVHLEAPKALLYNGSEEELRRALTRLVAKYEEQMNALSERGRTALRSSCDVSASAA
jgi:hypothetical protein